MKTKLLIFSFLFLSNFLQGQWIEPLGQGLTYRGEIFDFVNDELNNKLYTVGHFNSIDGKPMSNVGYYQDEEWYSILDTTKIEGEVRCVDIYKGQLFIGGEFTIKNSEKIENIAKLVNGKWTKVAEEISGSVSDMKWFDNELYISGKVTSIDGIKNEGLLKYSDGIWKNSGLYSELLTLELFVAGDTLFTFGNGLYHSSKPAHTVSFYHNEMWTTLPNIEDNSSEHISSIFHKGVLYSTIIKSLNDVGLYKFDFVDNEWYYITESSHWNRGLFEFQNELYARYNRIEIDKFVNDSFVKVEIDGVDFFDGFMYTLAVINNSIFIGGNFGHWNPKGLSLAKIDDWSIKPFGIVGSTKQINGSGDYTNAFSIVEYNNKFLIAGDFDFADNVFSSNLVYWDGENFSPFEVPLQNNIRSLKLFEGELYATKGGNVSTWIDSLLAPYDLIKFNGVKWEGVELPIEIPYISMKIIEDKLFVDNYDGFDSDVGGQYYLHNGEWKQLKSYPLINGIESYNYQYINPFKEGYIMIVEEPSSVKKLIYLPSEVGDWEVLVDSLNGGDISDVDVIDDRIYLINRYTDQFFKRRLRYFENDTIYNLIEDFESASAFFFKLNDKTFYSTNSMNLVEDDTVSVRNTLRVRDIMQVDENQFLIATNNDIHEFGKESISLKCLCLIRPDNTLSVEIQKDKEMACQKSYIQFWPKTKQTLLNYSWEFQGGTPSSSNSSFPMIKYDSIGTFNTKLTASNIEGETLTLETEVIINECDNINEIENRYDFHWTYGTNRKFGATGFDFSLNDTILVPRYETKPDLLIKSSVMSNSNGDLQFFVNGHEIHNMENQLIKGSECFAEETSSFYLIYTSPQSILSLPDVSNSNIYHIFNAPLHKIGGSLLLGSNKLTLTTIDMSLNDGLGEVINCNQVLIDDLLLHSTMRAVRHENKKDWWIIIGKYDSESYYRLLLTDLGIESIELEFWDNYNEATTNGASKFSPDGKYYAQVFRDKQEVLIWKFDNATGKLHDKKVITIVTEDEIESPTSCEFSPNSRFLYVSSATQMRQFDLCSYDNINSFLLESWDGTRVDNEEVFFGSLMLSPHQEIIVGSSTLTTYGIIKNPNELGENCNLTQHTLQISELVNPYFTGSPSFPHFRQYPSYEGNCDVDSNEELKDQFSISAFPNPLRDNNLLKFNKEIKGELYSLDGSFIFSFEPTIYLDMNSLPIGTYLIKTNEGVLKILKL